MTENYKQNYDSEHCQHITDLLGVNNKKEKVNQMLFKRDHKQYFLAKEHGKNKQKKKGIKLFGRKKKKKVQTVADMVKKHAKPKIKDFLENNSIILYFKNKYFFVVH